MFPLLIHVYRLHEESPSSLELDEEGEDCASSNWTLPAAEFHGLWDSLVFDVDIKNNVSVGYCRLRVLHVWGIRFH